jgi:signal transduction histidine kinase
MTIEKIRDRITALQAERKAVEREWPAQAEAAESIAAEVEHLAERGRDILNPSRLRKGKTDLTSHAASRIDVLSIVAALDFERTAARLAAIAFEAHPEPGISAADRRRRLAELDAELRSLEIEEERAIRSSPTPIVRRGDADPTVVLAPDLGRIAA